MRKSKKKIVLPSYLKLENYDGMDRLSALGWLFQLEARYQLYSSLDGFIDSSHSLPTEEKKNFLNLIIKDYFDKKHIENFMSRKVKRISEDMFYFDQHVSQLKKNVDSLREDLVRLANDVENKGDLSGVNVRLVKVEDKVNLALASIQTIQEGFLQKDETN